LREPTKMINLLLISVVDDDESVRESLPDLLRELGYEARAFPSARAFLASDDLKRTRCLILDVAMPEMTGPELQQVLESRGSQIPIIFITAHAGEITRPRLLIGAAVECLMKPFSEKSLIDALKLALPLN